MIQTLLKLLLKEYNPKDTGNLLANQMDLALPDNLKSLVEELARPRNIYSNWHVNEDTKNRLEIILKENCDWFYSGGEPPHEYLLGGWGPEYPNDAYVIGAHYDGPDNSPGADDNASCLAVIVKLSHYLSERKDKPKNIVLAFFNAEENGMLGSKKFVENHQTEEAIILEMVGYYKRESGTQNMPTGFPKD